MRSLISALETHYSPEYIANDGLILMCEESSNADKLHFDPVFGQNIYHADVDEIAGIDTDGEEFCISHR